MVFVVLAPYGPNSLNCLIPAAPVATETNIWFNSFMIDYQKDTNNQLQSLNHMPAKKRLDFIINHETPLKLVRETPTADLLMTIREIGAESSLELVEMFNGEQVQELFDLEIWSNDKLNVEVAGSYFSLLFEANREKALSQIQALDVELLGLMLKMVAEIYDSSLEEEPYDYPDLVSTSPDQRFIVCFPEKPGYEALARGLYTFLEDLYGRDLSFALRLLESVRFELASGLEEESQRLRENRLLDFGILPREERLEFFSPISASDIKNLFTRPTTPWPVPPNNVLPTYAQKINDTQVFLKQALFSCSDETKTAFWQGFTHATVNMHASLSGDFGDREEILKVADYVKYLAELGLFQASKGQSQEASLILAKSHPKYLIRLGRTALVALRRRLVLKTKDKDYLFGDSFQAADSPLREVARALSLAEPRYFEGLLEPQKLTIRFFASLSELNATVLAVNELIFRAGVVGPRGLGFTADTLSLNPELSHANLLARALVNGYFGTPTLDKISFEQAGKLFDNHRTLTSDFKKFADHFSSQLAEQFSAMPLDSNHTVAHFVTSVLIQLEQNWQLGLG